MSTIIELITSYQLQVCSPISCEELVLVVYVHRCIPVFQLGILNMKGMHTLYELFALQRWVVVNRPSKSNTSKLCGSYMVTHSNWTLTFEWYMITFVFKNEHQKDTRYNEIGRCAKNINTILGFTCR